MPSKMAAILADMDAILADSIINCILFHEKSFTFILIWLRPVAYFTKKFKPS